MLKKTHYRPSSYAASMNKESEANVFYLVILHANVR